jgi:ubiquinone/menaquinone biosynthesis C-methylase UbiE
MPQGPDYVLGESERAARRLAIQDAHFAEVSERLLDELQLRPGDRVVELGCGAGAFSRRILRRLGGDGVLVGIDQSASLLDEARRHVAGAGPARFETAIADIAEPGSWLAGADVVVGRTVLHHVPMVEVLLGKLRAALRPGTRVGFLEPDFRAPLGRVAFLEATGRPELAALRIWSRAINHLYELSRLSPDVGASLARTLELAGYRHVQADWTECRSDDLALENMIMFYDEVRGRLTALGLFTVAEIDEQQSLLRRLMGQSIPSAWGIFRVVGET